MPGGHREWLRRRELRLVSAAYLWLQARDSDLPPLLVPADDVRFQFDLLRRVRIRILLVDTHARILFEDKVPQDWHTMHCLLPPVRGRCGLLGGRGDDGDAKPGARLLAGLDRLGKGRALQSATELSWIRAWQRVCRRCPVRLEQHRDPLQRVQEQALHRRGWPLQSVRHNGQKLRPDPHRGDRLRRRCRVSAHEEAHADDARAHAEQRHGALRLVVATDAPHALAHGADAGHIPTHRGRLHPSALLLDPPRLRILDSGARLGDVLRPRASRVL